MDCWARQELKFLISFSPLSIPRQYKGAQPHAHIAGLSKSTLKDWHNEKVQEISQSQFTHRVQALVKTHSEFRWRGGSGEGGQALDSTKDRDAERGKVLMLSSLVAGEDRDWFILGWQEAVQKIAKEESK